MKFHYFLTFGYLLLANLSLQAAPSLMNQQKSGEIVIHNRILATVNGEPISAVDIEKKLSLIFDQQFSEYAHIPEARHQFYQMNWQPLLKELIEKKLILEEAKKAKVEIADGELHREIDRRFGPNTLESLDKVGFTYEEAKEQLKEEMTLQRMIQMQVHSKAIRLVTPQLVQEAYETYATETIRPREWHYRVISVRNGTEQARVEAAHYLYQILSEGSATIDDLPQEIEGLSASWPEVTVRLGEENQHAEHQLAESYKEVLKALKPGHCSQPMAQKSRNSDETVLRIFCLVQFEPGGKVPFKEVEKQLEDQVLQKTIDRETAKYIKKLRDLFPIDEKTDQIEKPLFELK